MLTTLKKNTQFFLRYKLIRYLLVGSINTLVGWGLIFLAMLWFHWGPYLSNFFGYAVGIIVSFILNKFFTFKSRQKSLREFISFILALLIAYIVNLLILKLCIMFMVNHIVAQIIAGIFYVLISFLLLNTFTFKRSANFFVSTDLRK